MKISLCIILLPVVLSWSDFVCVILTQEAQYDSEWADTLEKSIIYQTIQLYEQENEEKNFYEEVKTPVVVRFNGNETLCYWNYLCLFDRLLDNIALVDKQWFVFLDSYSDVRMRNMLEFLKKNDPLEPAYYGHALYDEKMTIIHHFFGAKLQGTRFHYPDNSAGFVMSRILIQKTFDVLVEKNEPMPFFTIDPNHELARFIYDNVDKRMIPADDIFCLEDKESCCVVYIEPRYECESEKVSTIDIKAYVKTWSGNHETRLPVILNTWGPLFENIEYISDKEDENLGTISLGVLNTAKGHCAKTFAIMNKFISEDSASFKWLLIADDDTMLNVEAVLEMLKCYDSNALLIIGERYGYGATISGKHAYNYPTGGSGMIFSRQAAELLVSTCSCPNLDSPDDMVIGMCSLARKIPIIHSPAFHQAQPSDYSKSYLKKIWPISFHKFIDLDPIDLYENHTKLPRPPRPDNYAEPRDRLLDWDKLRSIASATKKIVEIHPEDAIGDSFESHNEL